MSTAIVMTENIRHWIEFGSWIAGGFATILAFIQIIREIRKNREQRSAELSSRDQDRAARQEDLRWKRAQAAKGLMDELLTTSDVVSALRMLDWPGDTIRADYLDEKAEFTVSRQDYRDSITVPKAHFSKKDQFICDAFDGLFWFFAIFEHYISIGLVTFEDVRFPPDYYVDILSRDADVFSRYLKHYGLDRASAFLSRFQAWNGALAVSGEPQVGFDDAFRGTTIGHHGGVPTDGRSFQPDE